MIHTKATRIVLQHQILILYTASLPRAVWLRQTARSHTQLKVEGSITWAANQRRGSTVLQVMAWTLRQARRCCTFLNLPAKLLRLVFRFALKPFRPLLSRSPMNACSFKSEAVLEFTNPQMENTKEREPLCFQRGLECGSMEAEFGMLYRPKGSWNKVETAGK